MSFFPEDRYLNLSGAESVHQHCVDMPTERMLQIPSNKRGYRGV